MSLFNELETTANVFLPTDSNSTKRTTWSYVTPNFTISINILNLSVEEQVIFEQDLATHKANVDSASASSLRKGARIVVGGTKYEITNTPVLRKLFSDTYTIILRQLDK